MSQKNKNNKNDDPQYITAELCQAYRDSIITQIKDIKIDIKRIDNRLWWILGSVVVLGITAIVVAMI